MMSSVNLLNTGPEFATRFSYTEMLMSTRRLLLVFSHGSDLLRQASLVLYAYPTNLHVGAEDGWDCLDSLISTCSKAPFRPNLFLIRF